MSEHDFVMTQKEAADFLNVSTKSISRYRKRGLPYKLVLNPGTGKQEVRFRQSDLDRWDEGRMLLATFGRDGEEQRSQEAKTASPARAGSDEFFPQQELMAELLRTYKDQIDLLRDQMEDMREQLARRDRQIDDLMRLMIGLQLEYKPAPAEQTLEVEEVPARPAVNTSAPPSTGTDIVVDVYEPPMQLPENEPLLSARADFATGKKVFSREQLSASVLHLRRKGKSYDEIARGLNRIGAATLSGRSTWTVLEVKTLLPSLMEADLQHIERG